ncbi:CTD small phosphatase-like protein 2 isoform X1 [Rhinatrema bivittatum]|uniref:CTD small phosphatase-like protein 2 isoform X1 n=1 Tax=Rhinatrema bivittatum TaxID=194408 RepID=UPI00112A8BF1|nr:CTD small phosphatase-like protein 2 isoform X1 [Rhinatrema bivittatum]XP_029470063.1 CTD small phosphatase-like protein 2 isoform X1 [Rhinatrema bivittatum]XP_029470064.1 CTD small phosphatase-like protein 2 isoform X1 [Rhinatrema bivittatum]
MILRSRMLPGQEPIESMTLQTPQKYPRSPKSPRSEGWHRKAELSETSCSTAELASDPNDFALRSPHQRTLRRAKLRKKRRQKVQEKVYAVSPLRERSLRVRFQLSESAIPDHAFFPVISFPPQDGVVDCCSLLHKERKKSVDLPCFADLPSDEAGELFNPYKFLCNIPQLSGIHRPRRKEIPFKTRSVPVCTLVLELEDTLVCCSMAPFTHFDYSFLIPFQDVYYKVYVKLRPFTKEFLETISKMYEIFVFTTAKREYAEKILAFLDPQKKLIRHRLFQEDCACIQGHYVKDLSVLKRSLASTVALDSAPHTFPYHISNRLQIQSWLGNSDDSELLKLMPVLDHMTQVGDVRAEISRRCRLSKMFSEH